MFVSRKSHLAFEIVFKEWFSFFPPAQQFGLEWAVPEERQIKRIAAVIAAWILFSSFAPGETVINLL
jgi:hypothetical protein